MAFRQRRFIGPATLAGTKARFLRGAAIIVKADIFPLGAPRPTRRPAIYAGGADRIIETTVCGALTLQNRAPTLLIG